MIFLGTGTQCEEESNYDFQVSPPPKHIRPWAGERRQLRQSGHLRARWAEPLGQGWPERVGWRSPQVGLPRTRPRAGGGQSLSRPSPKAGLSISRLRASHCPDMGPPRPHPLGLGTPVSSGKGPKGAGGSPSRAVRGAAGPPSRESEAEGRYAQHRAAEREAGPGPGPTAPQRLAHASAPGAQRQRERPSLPDPRRGCRDPGTRVPRPLIRGSGQHVAHLPKNTPGGPSPPSRFLSLAWKQPGIFSCLGVSQVWGSPDRTVL